MASNKIDIKRVLLQEVRDIAILILISTIPTYLFAGNKIFTNFSHYAYSILYGALLGWTIWKGNQLLGLYFDYKMPWEKNPTKTFIYRIAGSIIFSSIDIVIVSYLIYTYIYKINVFDDIKPLINYALVAFVIAMLITTIIYLYHFFISWRESLIQKENYKRDVLLMQYETLKSYVNPHFLFNSLSVLSSLVEKDSQKSQQFIKQLSDIYRYVLEQKDKEIVPLNVEFNFIKSFIELHRIRHGESLKVNINVDNFEGYIIPLSLQILIENALKHNIISEDEPLSISVNRDADYIVVQNNLQVRKVISDSGGIGLETIKKRYELISSIPLIIENGDGFFTVKLPIINNLISKL
ncbi:MAG TPA: hypothetical protein DIW31_00680 [Bacteroidales bacterium]|nr:hypothetical protein [Bacteroidales bacterium]